MRLEAKKVISRVPVPEKTNSTTLNRYPVGYRVFGRPNGCSPRKFLVIPTQFVSPPACSVAIRLVNKVPDSHDS